MFSNLFGIEPSSVNPDVDVHRYVDEESNTCKIVNVKDILIKYGNSLIYTNSSALQYDEVDPGHWSYPKKSD